MNLQWITSPLAMYGVFAAGAAAALHLVVTTRIEMRRQLKRHITDSQSSREAIALLEEKLLELHEEVTHDRLPAASYTPFTGLNVHKRAEALRMYRRGSDRGTVSTALGLPAAEVALLEKVHRLMIGRAAAAGA